MDELRDDPGFYARSHLLMGGAEMCAIKMMMSDDPEMQAFGRTLRDRVDWFFVVEPVDDPSVQDTIIVRPSQQP